MHDQNPAPTKEVITQDAGGNWHCPCGNTAVASGFFPCDAHGHQVEPTPQDWTTDLYVCADCGRLINVDTLEVTDRVATPVLSL